MKIKIDNIIMECSSMVKCTHKALTSVPSTVTIITTTINSNNELFLTTAIEDGCEGPHL